MPETLARQFVKTRTVKNPCSGSSHFFIAKLVGRVKLASFPLSRKRATAKRAAYAKATLSTCVQLPLQASQSTEKIDSDVRMAATCTLQLSREYVTEALARAVKRARHNLCQGRDVPPVPTTLSGPL